MEKLEQKIGYKFKNRDLLKTALTHSSFANESRGRHIRSNERLEFLGDSVLGMVTADYIFKQFSSTPEGELTKLRASVVCEQALFEEAGKIGLAEFLLLGNGEEAGGGRKRPSILSDAVEAVIGAIYIDGGLEAAKTFVLGFIKPSVAAAVGHKNHNDYKTLLQEIVQKNREEVLRYSVCGEIGPDHDKTFEVEVYLNSNVMAKGSGRSKKEAEQSAAREALKLMGIDA
jgi:ribonuclease-3